MVNWCIRTDLCQKNRKWCFLLQHLYISKMTHREMYWKYCSFLVLHSFKRNSPFLRKLFICLMLQCTWRWKRFENNQINFSQTISLTLSLTYPGYQRYVIYCSKEVGCCGKYTVKARMPQSWVVPGISDGEWYFVPSFATTAGSLENGFMLLLIGVYKIDL